MQRRGYDKITIIKFSDDRHLSCPKDKPYDDKKQISTIDGQKVINTITTKITPLMLCSEKIEDWIHYREWFKKSIEEIRKNHQLKKEKEELEQKKYTKGKHRATKLDPIS